MNDNEALMPQDPAETLPPEAMDLETILEEYRRRQMIEHLTGPVISVALHLIVMVFCFFFLAADKKGEGSGAEFKAVTVMPKSIEKPPEEKKLEELQEKFNEPVPTMEKPSLTDNTSVSENGGALGDFSDGPPSSNDGGEMDTVLEVKMSSSALKISGIYGGRRDSGRMGALRRYGSQKGTGIPKTEEAVLKALRWLKEHQSEDGSWSQTHPLSMSGLALLCFLAHNELADSKEFGNTVSKAMVYLTDRMNNVGEGKPAHDGADGHAYGHAIATYALAEAYGMTKNPTLKPVMEKGLAVIVAGQQPCGGWDYNYKKEARWDTSFAGWQIQALKAGFLAGSDNAQLPAALQNSLGFLQKSAYKGGRFHYASSEDRQAPHMQGVGSLCLQLLGQKDAQETKSALRWVKENITVIWNDEKRTVSNLSVNFDPYGWDYHTQAMFYAGTAYWNDWEKQFSKELVRGQASDGHWDAPPKRGGERAEGGEHEPYYATTLCCLMLEVYYRFLPSFRLDIKEDHKDGAAKISDLIE